MKKRILHVALAAFPLVVMAGEEVNAQGGGGGNPQIFCDNVAVGTASTTVTVLLTGVANQRYNICGWMATTGSTGSGTLLFSYSTVANVCTTSTTVLTSTMDVLPGAFPIDHQPTAFISAPNGMSICATPSVTAIKYMLFYSLD